MADKTAVMDGNEAATYAAYRTNEVISIYPITPASPMGELADLWSSRGLKNIWGSVPRVVEMQSEGGAAGTVHGSLQAGSLTTTFTASQGLLLMIPNMYKIAGELTPTVFHISARSVAAQALSIFGDHSDVLSARATGWAMLFGNSIQEVMDFSLIAQSSSLESRVPFLHIFDGFRTSHEVSTVRVLSDEAIRALINDERIREHRARALTPDSPVIRGTAQNPDVFFQARETSNPFYNAVPAIVEGAFDTLFEQTGRRYRLFDYVGAPDAERVIVLMGSGCETAEEVVRYLNKNGEKVGLIKVRLFRPFSIDYFLAAVPPTATRIAVLDRTKEPGSIGEPLYQDVVTAVSEAMSAGAAPFSSMPRITGGRYGLSSKEFTPAMIKGVFDSLIAEKPKNHFTVGIVDDVTHTHIDYDPDLDIEPDTVTRAVFWGLGSDGTVGANKNSIKIIGEHGSRDGRELYAQGYFVYDSKKSGARTISHLRFGPEPIRSTYLIHKANFVAVHQFGFLERYDTIEMAGEGATFLLNSPYGPDDVWNHLPRTVQEQIINKKLNFYVIDAYKIAKDIKLGGRINTIMQTCFFALTDVLPTDEAIAFIKDAIVKTYGKRGETVVRMNHEAVDASLSHLYKVEVPAAVTSTIEIIDTLPDEAPEFVRTVTATILAGKGDSLPVSALPVDGTYPTATTKWEKRNIAQEVPEWEQDLCIQCGKCVMVCPHAVIRGKLVDETQLAQAPDLFKVADASWREFPDKKYTLQVAVEDCTGCRLCVEVCPAKDKSQVGRKALNMVPRLPILDRDRANWSFFETLPEAVPQVGGDGAPAKPLDFTKVKQVQLLDPLFEFSSACAGCGETPYLGLMSRLFGDRAMIANATGCSSIYGGNLPTTPWTVNSEGRGPSWCNSLFEDNAEFGLGFRLAVDKQAQYARELVEKLGSTIGHELAAEILEADPKDEEGYAAQRACVARMKERLSQSTEAAARDLEAVADALVPRSVWIVGGDGWAYDIGYGGLDHVLASGENVNLLVLDTEVYSNTGGQASKATGLGAVAKFAAGGKPTPKKDLGLLAMAYGYVYVAQIALGANDNHTIKAFLEAEAYDGPSLIIAYSPCIAHGIDMARSTEQQKLATASGHWPLYRFDPRRKLEGKNPLQIDSKPPSVPLKDYIYSENRYRVLQKMHPDAAAGFLQKAQEGVNAKWKLYQMMAQTTSRGAAEGGRPKPGRPPARPGKPRPKMPPK